MPREANNIVVAELTKKTDVTDLTGFFFYRLASHDTVCFLPSTRMSGLLSVSSYVSFERYRTDRNSFSKDYGGYERKRFHHDYART